MLLKNAKPGMVFRHELGGNLYIYIGKIDPHPIFPDRILAILFRTDYGYVLEAFHAELDFEENGLLYLEGSNGENNREALLKMALLSAQGKRPEVV